jgi:drug/metabolite transporter (DMT)-like permease
MPDQIRMTPRAWALMALLALLWGGSFAATTIMVSEMPPLTVVAFRVGAACVVLWVYVLWRGYPFPPTARSWAMLLALGITGNALPFSLITWGQLTVPSGLSAILNASTAVFGVLVAAMFFRDERLTAQKLIGVGLGFLGVSIAIGLQALSRFDASSLGQMAIIVASLSYAFTSSLGKIALRGVVPQVVATGMMTGATLVMVPLALWSDGLPGTDHAPQVWLAMAYSAIIATALAYLLFYRLLAMAGAGYAGLLTLLVAPVAIVLGALLLQETLPLRAYLGFGVLALGLVILDGSLLRLLANRRTSG